MSQASPTCSQEGPAEFFHAAEIDQPAFRKVQVADDDVFADGEVGEQVEFLIDDADAEALRVQRGGDFDRRAIQRNEAAIGARGPGENARQRALAGAVLAHQGVHFPGAEREIRAFERIDAAVVFGDSYRLKVLGQVLLCRSVRVSTRWYLSERLGGKKDFSVP